jgi:hypothetical protein
MAKRLRLFFGDTVWNLLEQDLDNLKGNILNHMESQKPLELPLDGGGLLLLKVDGMTPLCLFTEEEVPVPVAPTQPPFRYPGVSSIHPGRVIMRLPGSASVGYPGVSSVDPWRVIMDPPA